jgi:hypothetical protein
MPQQEASRTLRNLILAFAALWSILWFLHALHYVEDDAYIHLEFARSVAAGQSFAFNGHIVNGDTSPLWVYLLVAAHTVLPTWIAAAKLLNLLGVAFAATGAFVFARRLTGNALFAASMVLLFVLNPYFTYWAYSGMETITAAGLALWACTLVSDTVLSWPRLLTLALLTGLAPITRPEMVFLSALLGALLVLRWLRMPGSLPTKLAGLAAGLVLAVGPTLAWSLYAIHLFGRVIPTTNAAKQAGPHESVPLRLVTVYALGYPVVVAGVLAGLAWLLLRNKKTTLSPQTWLQTLPAGGWVFLLWSAIAAVFYVADHTYVQTRYVFVTASGLTITILAIVLLAFPRILRPAAISFSALALILSLVATWPFVANKSLAVQANTGLALWVRQNLPADAPVAIYAVGQLAFDSQHPVIDIGGITRPSAIPYINDPVLIERWARAEGATYYISGDRPEPNAVLIHTVDEPTTGWSLNPRHYRQQTQIRLWKLP